MIEWMRGQANILILFFIVAVLIFGGSALFKNRLQQFASSTIPAVEKTSSSGSSPNFQPSSGTSVGAAPQTGANGSASPKPVTPPAERAGAVTVSGVSPSYDGERATVTLQTNLNDGESVDVTGWMLETNKRRLYLPQAVRAYQVNGANTEGDMVLQKGNYVTLYAGSLSPVGYSFRVNKCMGYLDAEYQFPSLLPNECPVPARSSYETLAGWCQNYIQSLGNCALPSTMTTNSWRGDDGNACRSFVNDFFTVAHCYQSFQGDALLDNEWRVWVNIANVFDPQHDVVKLINTDGKVISTYVY